MTQNSFFKFMFLFILSTINVVAQDDSVNLKDVWENSKNPDSVRFKALGDYYALNNQAQPVATLKVLDYYYQLSKEKNNTRELYNVANYRGGIYRLKGESDSAFKYYDVAQKLAEELNDLSLKATILGNIGNVYAHKRDYTNALHFFSKSFKIFKSIKDKKGESHMLMNIGNVYLYIQNYDLALKYYQKSLSVIKDIEVPQRRIAVIYLNIAWTNYELEEYRTAIPYYNKALKILELTNDKFFLVSCYSTLAKIHLKLEEIQKATYYAEKSNKISNELEMPGFITDAKIIFAQIELKKGNIESAKKMGESILEGFDINTGKDLKLNLYDLLYKVYQAENNSKRALEMYQKFTSYKDSIQVERKKLTLIREVVKNEFDDLLLQNEQNLLKEKAELESKQKLNLYIISIIPIISIGGIIFYFNRYLKRSRKKRDELLREIEMLKRIDVNNLKVNSETVQSEQMEMDHFPINSESENLNQIKFNKLPVNSNEFQLIREKIESSINRKLNATDWNVLNILLKEPDLSNKEIAEKAFMSVDGIGSSLRRMYIYFNIKESKYKKIALIMEAIKASS